MIAVTALLHLLAGYVAYTVARVFVYRSGALRPDGQKLSQPAAQSQYQLSNFLLHKMVTTRSLEDNNFRKFHAR